MSEVVNADMIKYVKKFNNDFEEKYGYMFCRCYSCFLPLLLKRYMQMKSKKLSINILKNVIQDINDDYLYSAEFRMETRARSGIVCGYDCIHYENAIEACPIAFWEIDKTHFPLLLHLLDTLVSFSINSESPISNI